jgi:hypothetical protein
MARTKGVAIINDEHNCRKARRLMPHRVNRSSIVSTRDAVEKSPNERSYFLLREPQYIRANQESLTRVKEFLGKIRDLTTREDRPTHEALENVALYEQQFGAAVSLAKNPGGTAVERVQQVVQAYGGPSPFPYCQQTQWLTYALYGIGLIMHT